VIPVPAKNLSACHSQAPKKPMGVLAYAAVSGGCRDTAPGEGKSHFYKPPGDSPVVRNA